MLIRHGETEWSKSGRHTSHTDLSLTEEGRRQAALLGKRISRLSFDLVLTSPLTRAAQTCELAGLAGSAVTTDDLVEWDYGEYEGRRTLDIRDEHPGWTLWDDGAPGGETAAQVTARTRHVVDLAREAGGHVAAFAHGHILRALTACWLDRPVGDGRYYALSPATVSVLGYEREQAVILSWNDGSHLDH